MKHTAIDLIEVIDETAAEANSLWLRLETIKLQIAEHCGLTLEDLKRYDIHIEGVDNDDRTP